MTVSSEGYQGWTVLRVAGEIDLVTGGQIRTELHRLVAEGHRQVVLDLGAVRFCDSSGVGVLIGARRLLRSCSGELRLVLPPSGQAGGLLVDRPGDAVRDPARDAVRHPGGGQGGSGAESGHVHRVFTALGLRRLFDIYPDVPSAATPPAPPTPLARPA